MNVWNGKELIIDDSGKNATCQLQLTEQIPGEEEIKRSVSIEDGRVLDKQDDVDIIGKRTSKGFVLRGIELNTERTKKCIICGKYKNIKDFWDSDRKNYSNLCKECRENSYIIEEECSPCWIR
jgi:hypothetical protein